MEALPSILPEDTTPPVDGLSRLLAQVEGLEALRQELEEGREQLQGRIDAALGPLLDRIVEVRRELMRFVLRRTEGASRRLREDGRALVLDMAADLEERLGADVREFTDVSGTPDEEEDDDLSWAKADPAPARTQERQRPPRVPRSLDPEAAARGIYRSLARELHPDKTRVEAEKARRTELMHALNAAWAARDLGALLALLDAHGSREAREGALDRDALKACLHGLEERCKELSRIVKELRHTRLPEGVTDWLPLVREEARFAKALRRITAPARDELRFLDEIRRWWLSPGGLEDCLRDPPEGLA